ncbi:MAG: tetratricopeptide repeat protein, partial [Candidatus Obscuribacterales bacterium]|nr:tetratricopeptide repeat protein [Candidatus Obscuribacterales bacterium]
LSAYENALKIDPQNQIAKDNIALTHNNWGIQYFSQKLFAEARKEWELALKMNPHDGNVKRNLQILDMHEKRISKAKQDQEEAQEKTKEEKAPAFTPAKIEATIDDSLEKVKEEEKNNKPPQAAVILSTGSGSVSISNDGKVIGRSSSDSDNTGGGGAVIIPKAQSSYPNGVGYKKSTFTTFDPSKVSSVAKKKTPPQMSSPVKAPTQEAIPNPVLFKPSGEKLTTGDAEAKNSRTKSDDKKRKKKSSHESKSDGDSDDNTLADVLSRLEEQVFGKKRDSMPILKRLEQLEIDTSGKKKSGAIKGRIQSLQETYGL